MLEKDRGFFSTSLPSILTAAPPLGILCHFKVVLGQKKIDQEWELVVSVQESVKEKLIQNLELLFLESKKIILRWRVATTLQHCRQNKVCVPNLCYMLAISLPWFWDPTDSQFHIKFLFILALHAFVCASVIGNHFTTLLSSYPLSMFVCCLVLFVQSRFWAFFLMII